MPRNQITLSEVIGGASEQLRASMYHCLPGIVQAYHASEQTADVLPAVNDPRFDPDTGERLTFDANGQPDDAGTNDEPWPVIPHVPVSWPKFGGFVIAGPLAPGNRVLLVAFDLDPTKHRNTGQVENPIDVRRHGGTYWWCIPADITDPGVSQDAAAAGSSLVIGKDGASQQIRIDGNHINLGSAPTDSVALAQKIDSLITILVNAGPGSDAGYNALVSALQTWKGTNWSAPTPTVGSSLIHGQ